MAWSGDIGYRGNTGVQGMKDISPSDTALANGTTRGIFCTVTGDARLVFSDGDEQLLPLTAGTLYSFFVTHVKSSGTTATVKACY